MSSKCFLIAAACGALVIVDRFLKLWFARYPSDIFGGNFIFGRLLFHFEINRGIAFGIPVPAIILFLTSIVIFAVLISLLIRFGRDKKNLLLIIALTLILAGAASNFFDRVVYGYVIDYIDVPWFTVFNVADVMISLGVIILAVSVVNKKERMHR